MAETNQEPVSRKRRFRFIAILTAFCLGTAVLFSGGAGLGYLPHQTALISTYVEAVIGLATAVVLAYVGGSVIDYNGGLVKLTRPRRQAAEKAEG